MTVRSHHTPTWRAQPGRPPRLLAALRRPGRRTAHRVYVAAMLAAVAVIAAVRAPAIEQTITANIPALLIVAALAVLADVILFARDGDSRAARVHASVLPVFAILLEWARGTALLTQVAALVTSGLLARRPVGRIAFDIGRYGLALFMAARVLSLGQMPYTLRPHHHAQLLLILGASAAWFATFHLLTTTDTWLRGTETWLGISRRTLNPEALWAIPLLLLAPLLVGVERIDSWLVPLVLAPMYAVTRSVLLLHQKARQERVDTLTRFANRPGLTDKVDRWTAGQRRAHRSGKDAPVGRYAMLVLDLNRFRYVNEALGHDVGDRVLCALSRRLTGLAGRDSTVARIGGDEFGVFAPGVTDVAGARDLAEHIEEGMADPVTIDGLPVEVTVSIGVALYPEHGPDVTALLRHAGQAMHSAKLRDEPVVTYRPEPDSAAVRRLRLVGDLRRALEHPDGGGIQVCFQPQVDLGTGRVAGVEALLRWNHPVHGPVSPDEIVQVAEHTAVMRLLTERVLEATLTALNAWRARGIRLRASVNLSVRDLYGTHLPGWLADRLSRCDLEPGQVQLEITESALMADPDRAIANVHRLHRLGIAVALDDFGTGYSSLAHLRRLPVSEVKIDRSFIASLMDNPDDDAIVRSIIGLARELGMRVVAEGVEDEATARALHRYGCDLGQGWLFAPAMPADELPAWLDRFAR